MGLFDKIKDNAKNISMRALYEEVPEGGEAPVAEKKPAVITPDTPAEIPGGPEDTGNTFDETPISVTTKESTKEPETTKRTEEPKSSDKPDTASKPTPRKITATRPIIKKPAPREQPKKAEYPAPQPAATKPKLIDVAPHRGVLDPSRKAIYARERAAMVALAARRRMDGTVPIYTANHLTFKTRVFIDRIEYSGSFGKNVLPVDQVSWIKLRAGGTGVILETSEGKRVVMVIKPKDRLAFAEAVMKVQDMQPKREKFKDTKTVRIDQLDKFSEGVDEIEKLARLYDKGIISQEEFDTKKKQILGI